MHAGRQATIRLRLKVPDRPSRPTSKDVLVAEYKHWQQAGRSTPVTPRLLTGLFYLRYKEQFRLYPPSDIRDDIAHMQLLLRNFLTDDPALGPAVIEVFFTLKQFRDLKTASVCNRNVLTGWSIFEKARRWQQRNGVLHGEQAEFLPSTTNYGSVRV